METWRVINQCSNVIVWERTDTATSLPKALQTWVDQVDFDCETIQVLIGFSPFDLWVEKRSNGRWLPTSGYLTDEVDVYEEVK